MSVLKNNYLWCSIGIHQGEWTKTGCQQRRLCIFCGELQNREEHNWKAVGEYFQEGSCEKRVTCRDCKKTKSIGTYHKVRKPWWWPVCKRCGVWLDHDDVYGRLDGDGNMYL